MENNIIRLPGKIDVSLIEGGQLVFVINLTYDSTNSSIDDGLFLFLPDKTVEEIESAINNNNIVVYLQYPLVSQIFNLLLVDNQLVRIDRQIKSKLIWDIDYLYAYTLNWDYDSEADIPESTNSFSLWPAASFDIEVNLSGGTIINGDTIIGNIYYDYPSHKIVAEEYALGINETCVEALSSSNKAYLLGHENFEDFSPAVINSAAYMLNGKLYSNSTEVATQTDISTVTAVAEGKTKSYVTNKTRMSGLNSLNDTVSISSFTDLNGTSVALSNFKVGDIVYLTDTEIPDRWVSAITKSGNTVTGLTLSKMETSKVDLDSYVPKTRTIAGVDLQDDITASELYGKSGVLPFKYFEIGTRTDYWDSVILLFDESKVGQYQQIYGKIFAINSGGNRHSVADVNMYRYSWASGNEEHEYSLIQPQRYRHFLLVRCTYNNKSWIALRDAKEYNNNIQATTYCFAGYAVNTEFSLQRYYFNKTNNESIAILEIYDSITDATSLLETTSMKSIYLYGKTNDDIILAGGGTKPISDFTLDSKSAASGGTNLSLVTTGEKYTWNSKVSANDGTLTLKKGNTTLGTFSANASANTTINIPDKLEEFDSGQVSADATFTYRTTAGENREIDDGVAKIEKLKGNTVVWNQMANINTATAYDVNSVTVTNNNNVFEINIIKAGSGFNVGVVQDNINTIVGHKYYFSYWFKCQDACDMSSDIWGGLTSCILAQANVWSKYAIITQATRAGTRLLNRIYPVKGNFAVGDSYLYATPQLIDLTLMFGAGNEPATVAAFEEWLDANVGLKDYYPYDAGSLIPVKDTTLKTVGFNLWDEEWEVGGIMSGSINSKNFTKVIPNTTYYFRANADGILVYFYDINKNEISSIGALNTTFTTPTNCYFVKFRVSTNYGTTYRNGICINFSDASKNGTYEPYWENNLLIPITTLKGKVVTNGVASGSPVVMFPDGLKSAGSVYDEINLKTGRAVKRIGKVDLGSLSWYFAQVSGFADRFYSTLPLAKPASSYSVIANILSEKYSVYSDSILGSVSLAPNKGIAFNSSRYIYARDTDYSNATTFKTAMSGVYLYYELDTPVEYELEDYTSEIEYKVDNNGTEEIISDYANPTLSIKYNVNAVDSIRNLPDVYVSAVEGQKFNSALKAIARNNIGLGTLATKSSLVADDIPSITKDKISDFPTIPSVGTGTLTIQKAGTNVATFGANATSNVTANIPNEITTITLTYDSINSSPNNGSFIYTPDISSSTMSTLLLNNAPIRVQASYVSSVFNLLWVSDVLVFLSKRGNMCIATELFYDIDYDYMYLFVYDDENNVFTLEPIPSINNYSVVQSSTSGLRLEVVQSMPANPNNNTIYIVQ